MGALKIRDCLYMCIYVCMERERGNYGGDECRENMGLGGERSMGFCSICFWAWTRLMHGTNQVWIVRRRGEEYPKVTAGMTLTHVSFLSLLLR